MKKSEEPNSLEGTALFLLGKGSNYITGKIIVVDGGVSL
ncbi:SDR family oxidoreductase [Peribacillus asahii]